MLELNDKIETQFFADTIYFTKDRQQIKYAKLNQHFCLFLWYLRAGELRITTTKKEKELLPDFQSA